MYSPFWEKSYKYLNFFKFLEDYFSEQQHLQSLELSLQQQHSSLHVSLEQQFSFLHFSQQFLLWQHSRQSFLHVFTFWVLLPFLVKW
ncbi:hypothetical protein PRV_00495 [Mycoplasma parvum str. Indiana]|uniref:Uncharacterized protein n=1 Tax=Mycoplasma parvum str. Indiana TaxID=1403316 RepID=U5NF91_9MOLU|nr:hypothetical protein PRV_00495 [Mycoplasma parvum str. Indiana]